MSFYIFKRYFFYIQILIQNTVFSYSLDSSYSSEVLNLNKIILVNFIKSLHKRGFLFIIFIIRKNSQFSTKKLLIPEFNLNKHENRK